MEGSASLTFGIINLANVEIDSFKYFFEEFHSNRNDSFEVGKVDFSTFFSDVYRAALVDWIFGLVGVVTGGVLVKCCFIITGGGA